MNPSLARILPTALVGALLFGAGFWWGGRSEPGDNRANAKSAAAIPAKDPGETLRTPGGGSADLGLPQGGFAGNLEQVLATANRRQREAALLALGGRDFAVGADWKSISAGIRDLVDRTAYLKGYFQAWAEKNPREASDEVLKRGLSERSSLLPETIAVWAEQEPTAAEAWLVNLRSGEARDVALEALYRTWASIDPANAVDRGLRLPEEASRFRALAAAIREWSASDPSGVGAWAARLDDPNLKDFAMMAAADELAVRSPKAAMQWASGHLAADPQANPEIVNLVASKAGFESPRETFDWLLTLPDAPENQSSIAGVAAYLTEDNPDFAFREFPQLPEGLQDLTAAPIASTLGAQDPETGRRWLDSLPEGETRRFATSAFAAGWATRDFGAAEAWVARMPEGEMKTAAAEGLKNAFGGSGDGAQGGNSAP